MLIQVLQKVQKALSKISNFCEKKICLLLPDASFSCPLCKLHEAETSTNAEIIEQDTFRLITVWKSTSSLDSDALEMNKTVIRFQREVRMMEGFETNSSELRYTTLRQVSEEKQINQQAGSAGKLLFF